MDVLRRRGATVAGEVSIGSMAQEEPIGVVLNADEGAVRSGRRLPWLAVRDRRDRRPAAGASR